MTPPLPARCAARAVAAREAWAPFHSQLGAELDTVLARIVWDAPAAGEFPRPLLQDAADLERHRPDLGERVWHLAAGAVILWGGCDCNSPAGYRDLLVDLAAEVRGTNVAAA